MTFGEERQQKTEPSGSWLRYANPGFGSSPSAFRPRTLEAPEKTASIEPSAMNPEATVFEPEYVRQLRQQEGRIERLERLIQNQAELISEASRDIEEMMGELHWASKDIKEVRDALKAGNVNAAINTKKLDYRAMDIDGIMKRQGNWRKALHSVLIQTREALGLEDEDIREK